MRFRHPPTADPWTIWSSGAEIGSHAPGFLADRVSPFGLLAELKVPENPCQIRTFAYLYNVLMDLSIAGGVYPPQNAMLLMKGDLDAH